MLRTERYHRELLGKIVWLRCTQWALRTYNPHSTSYVSTQDASNLIHLYGDVAIAAYNVVDQYRYMDNRKRYCGIADATAKAIMHHAMMHCASLCTRYYSLGGYRQDLYSRMCQEAERLAWPTHYREDLYIHDLISVRALDQNACHTLYWVIRPSGTHLLESLMDFQTMAQSIGTYGQYYVWRDGALAHVEYSAVQSLHY